MSATTARPPGRPATGITKSKPSVTIDAKLVTKAKRQACKEGMNFSAYVERALAKYLTGAEA